MVNPSVAGLRRASGRLTESNRCLVLRALLRALPAKRMPDCPAHRDKFAHRGRLFRREFAEHSCRERIEEAVKLTCDLVDINHVEAAFLIFVKPGNMPA
jgi:hypothetical protein